jgi:cytosine/adenosine deaminase-related metal-dependent hydrolase
MHELKAPLLIEKCKLVATGTEELAHADVLIDGTRFVEAGAGLREKHRLPADTPTIDGRGHLAVPGFVNTHHHMWQVLTRSIRRVQNSKLFEWLVEQYNIWIEVDEEAVHAATRIAFAELLLTGCTTTSDHHYLWPAKAPKTLLDEQFRIAAEMGIRFYPTRGSMTLGVKDGGLPPMELVEDDDTVLAECERLAKKFHDPSDGSMRRIALAPCSPFNVTQRLFVESARLARAHGLRLHTHLAETDDEDAYCLEKYGCRPFDFIARLDWEGPDVWLAHCVKLNGAEIARMARAGMSVAHCPSANARLGSGIAPVREMLRAGVGVSIGVDGSASNDSGSYVSEMRTALMMQRSRGGHDAITCREVLRLATQGGAAVLGNPALGRIAPGAPADVVLFDMEQIGYAGGPSTDPVAALILCGTSHHCAWSIINGRVVVERGKLVGVPERALVSACNAQTERLLGIATKRFGIDYSVALDRPGE